MQEQPNGTTHCRKRFKMGHANKHSKPHNRVSTGQNDTAKGTDIVAKQKVQYSKNSNLPNVCWKYLVGLVVVIECRTVQWAPRPHQWTTTLFATQLTGRSAHCHWRRTRAPEQAQVKQKPRTKKKKKSYSCFDQLMPSSGRRPISKPSAAKTSSFLFLCLLSFYVFVEVLRLLYGVMAGRNLTKQKTRAS